MEQSCYQLFNSDCVGILFLIMVQLDLKLIYSKFWYSLQPLLRVVNMDVSTH
jgi:hypothetical protein